MDNNFQMKPSEVLHTMLEKSLPLLAVMFAVFSVGMWAYAGFPF